MKFNGIQVLRLIAASMVVGLHSTFYIGTRVDPNFPKWDLGYFGVHIFFVISGFVMVLTSRDSTWRDFALNRIIRIVPLYWFVNAIKIAAFLAVPTAMLVKSTPLHIALSLFFIPSRDENGTLEPFYGVGWTLNFEMMFYALFTLALLLRRKPLIIIPPVLVLLAAASAWKTPDWPAISFYCDPIVLNFLWGMLIAEFLPKVKLNAMASSAILILGVAGTMLNAQLIGLQFAALVAAMVLLEPYIGDKWPGWAIKGGGASYALYLIHPMVGPAVTTVVARFSTLPSVIIVSIFAVSLAASLALFSGFEVPVSRILKRWHGRHSASAHEPGSKRA